MPQAVAAAIVAAVPSAGAVAFAGLTYAAVISNVAFLVGGAAVAQRQRRRALRQANAELQDRRFTVRGSAEPQQIVLGRTRVGGVQLAPGWSWGDQKQHWTVPIAFAGHPVTSFDDIWLGEESVGTLDGSGNVTAGSKWYKARSEARVVTITGGAPSATYTFGAGARDLRVDSIAQALDGSSYTLVPGVDYTTARNGSDSLVITWVTDWTGISLVVTYTLDVGQPFARFKRFLGTAAGERDTELETNSGGEWAATDIGCNIARLHPTFTFDSDIYPSGAPQASAIISGVKAYDCRKDSTNGGSGAHRYADPATWEWTENPALLWAWYMTWSGGGRRPFAKINWPSVATAANICDETVPINGSGGSQKRYTCNGVLSTGDDVRVNVDRILSSMVGTRFYSGGQWYVRAGAYVVPTLDLTDNDFAPGDIVPRPRPKRRDLFNSVMGLYVDDHAAGALGAGDAGGFYALTNFPAYSSATYVAEDNGDELWEEIELPLTHDWRRAQRIAKLMLFRARQALTVSATWRFGKAYRLQPGDTLRLTSAPNGWTNKVFRVVDRTYAPHGDVQLLLQEEASAVYAWDFDEATDPDPAPNTDLPDPRFVAPLANFAVSAGDSYTLPDGSVVPYAEASWSAVTDSAVLSGGRIELWWKRSIDTAYRKIDIQPADVRYRIEPVSGGDTINAYAWVFNGSQVRSQAVFATRGLRADLPPGVVTPPLSANLIQNADFLYSTDKWQVEQYQLAAGAGYSFAKESSYPLRGTPSNCRITIQSTQTGVGAFARAYPPAIPVDATRRYVAFCGLIGWGCDAVLAFSWYDANDSRISDSPNSNTVAGVPVESADARPDRLDHYTTASAFLTPPAGARYARMFIVAAGNFLPGNLKYVFGTKPFFGEIEAGVTALPAWDPGGAGVIDTPGIVIGAATEVVTEPMFTSINLCAAVPGDTSSTPGAAVQAWSIRYTAKAKCTVVITMTAGVSFNATTGNQFSVFVTVADSVLTRGSEVQNSGVHAARNPSTTDPSREDSVAIERVFEMEAGATTTFRLYGGSPFHATGASFVLKNAIVKLEVIKV